MKDNKEHSPILEQIAHSDGMTVPEGYFADFAARMEAALPERKPVEPPVVRTTWQKVRTYVYMAAMFAGIWCMMKTLDLMRPSTPMPGEVLTEALNDDNFISDYYLNNVYEDELLNNLYEEGISPYELCAYN
ncbi:MAG: hypothetical protein HFJ94_07755 [Muribaculaceae bacterium]|jgi:hypothetical protein|nr:hypothetical protein [Muribaculaceae bacterium]